MNPKENVLIDENYHARLTDYGLASIIPRDQLVVIPQNASLTAPTTWAAPEISKGGSVTKAGDIFAFGMVVAEVCTGGVFGRSFSTHPLRADVYRAFPVRQMLHSCVKRWTS